MIGPKKKPQVLLKDDKARALILKIEDYDEVVERAEDVSYARELNSKAMEFRNGGIR